MGSEMGLNSFGRGMALVPWKQYPDRAKRPQRTARPRFCSVEPFAFDGRTGHVREKVMAAKDVIAFFQKQFGSKPAHVVEAPGRLELLGNHTDYNQGLVLALAVDK